MQLRMPDYISIYCEKLSKTVLGYSADLDDVHVWLQNADDSILVYSV